MALNFLWKILNFFSALLSVIFLYLSTLLPGFTKLSNDFKPGENPSRIRPGNPFSNMFRSSNTNSGPNRSDFQRSQRENFYTQRRDTGGNSGGPGLDNCFMGGGG